MTAEQIEQYGHDVLSGKIPACEYVKLSVKRHFDDLKKTDWGYYFDVEAGLRPVHFFSILRHYRGRFYNKPFVPEPWQAWILYVFFGWKRENGLRRFKYSYIEVPRKNGKTTFIAGKALYHFMLDGEYAPGIYFAATKEKQARIALDEARFIGMQTPEVKSRLNILKYSIEYDKMRGKMESLGSDSKKQDGLNVSHGVLDEVHEHKTFEMFEVLKTACGMREQPIIDLITTAGFDKSYPCYTYRKHCIDVLSGIKEQNNLFSIIYTLDADDDWKDPANWSKANPSWNILNQDEFREEAEAAMINPSEEIGFKTKRLNIWTDAPDVWITDEDWMKNVAEPVSYEVLKDIPCFVGMDFASSKDLNAMVMQWPDVNGRRYVKCWFWIPETKVYQKEDIVDYRIWKEEGYISVIEGNAVDHEQLAADMIDILGKYTVEMAGYDVYGIGGAVAQMIINSGFPMDKIQQFKQTTLYLSPAVKKLEEEALLGKLNHEGNPILRWNASNVVIYQDSSGAIKFNKVKSIDKIDGMVALAMAIGVEMNNEKEKPIDYEFTVL